MALGGRTALTDGVPVEGYNVGGGVERSNLEPTRRILAAVGASEDLVEVVEDRPGHDARYALDTTKISELGWEPEWTFEAGLETTVEWFTERTKRG